MTVLRRRVRPRGRGEYEAIDLHGADLEGADLWGVDFRKAILYGVDLRTENHRKANLWEALLFKSYLRKADLRGAKLGPNHSEADFRRGEGSTRLCYVSGERRSSPARLMQLSYMMHLTMIHVGTLARGLCI